MEDKPKCAASGHAEHDGYPVRKFEKMFGVRTRPDVIGRREPTLNRERERQTSQHAHDLPGWTILIVGAMQDVQHRWEDKA